MPSCGHENSWTGAPLADPRKRDPIDSAAPPAPVPGGIAARARAAAGAPVSRRPQSGAAAGGRDPGRAGAGAGRRRNRQDARADHADRAHSCDRTGAAERDPGGHLHQQGGARDEEPRRPDGGADGRGHAVARHLPFDRREDPPPPRRAGRASSPTSPSSTSTTRSACSSSCWRPRTSTRSAGRRACSPACSTAGRTAA